MHRAIYQDPWPSRRSPTGENGLLLGRPDVGKTHLVIGLSREAILAGYSVQFITAMALVAGRAKAHAEKPLDEKLLGLSKAKLLIVDELGYLPLGWTPRICSSSW